MENYITIPQLAAKMGITRDAVYKKVKAGKIPAVRIGRNYFITREAAQDVLGQGLKEERKQEIEGAVKRTVKEYGEVLEMLGDE